MTKIQIVLSSLDCDSANQPCWVDTIASVRVLQPWHCKLDDEVMLACQQHSRQFSSTVVFVSVADANSDF